MRLVRYSAFLALACFLIVGVAGATDHFAAPNGTRTGDGSIGNPWDLDTALGSPSGTQPATLFPGDTLWLRGGTYVPATSNGFLSHVNGTAAAPIIVRNYNGERATISPPSGDAYTLAAFGSYTWYWGLEITTTNPTRSTGTAGSGANPLPYGLSDYGPNNKFINCVVHDTAQGIETYNAAANGEYYGNVIYYNGWVGPDRNHGHGMYLQNSTGAKLAQDNIIGDNADEGTQIYGSGSASLLNITYDGNTVYNNSSWPYLNYQYNFLLGGGRTQTGNSVTNNMTFFEPAAVAGYVNLGIYGSPGSMSGLTATNNVFVGGYLGPAVDGMSPPVTFTGNRLVIAPIASRNVSVAPFAGQSEAYTWGNNQYYGGPGVFVQATYGTDSSGNDSEIIGSYMPFSSWQANTGFDANSTYSQTFPTGSWVFVRPNKYEAKRANVTIYNWNEAATVSVDLSNVLSVGDVFVVQDAQNFYGAAVASGTYSGGTVAFPMNLTAKVAIAGSTTPPHTSALFDSFVVMVPGAGTLSAPANVLTSVSKANWALVYVDSQETQCENGAAVNGFDGNSTTIWHTQYCPAVALLPHEIQIDMGTAYAITGFRYLPRQDGGVNGRIGQYEFYATNDLSNWGTALSKGSFANDATEKQVLFTSGVHRYVRLRALTEANGGPWTSMAELSVLQSSTSGSSLSSIAITPSNSTIAVGTSQQFTATGTFQNSSTQDITSQVTWSSSNPSVTIAASGIATGQSAGNATITATQGNVTGSVTAIVQSSTPTSLTAISKTNWVLAYADSQETQCENGAAVNAFDASSATIWHTQYCPAGAPLPHEIQIDMGTGNLISGFRYLPRQDGGVNGRIGQYEFYATSDLSNWGSPLATGTFADDATEKQVLFAPNTYRYVRLRALTEANGGPWTSMAELTVLQSSTGSQ